LDTPDEIKEIRKANKLRHIQKNGYCDCGGKQPWHVNGLMGLLCLWCNKYVNDSEEPDLKETPKEELKKFNSAPGATHCKKCNNNLKIPYPGIQYCPICEK
jgi:hypothetical protein